MSNSSISINAEQDFLARKSSIFTTLGIIAGVVMPFIAALFYPTYIHIMQRPWVEWTRLQEIPFVACEILVMLWALRKGMNSKAMWLALSRDLKFASIMLIIGIFASTLLFSAAPMYSLAISLITLVHLLFALSVFHLIKLSSATDYSSLIIGLGSGLILLTVLTAWRFGFPPPASQVPGGVIEWSSALPGFISVRHFGSWTGAVTAAFLTILLYADDRQRPSWPHFFYFLSAAMTVWSGTRAAILALVVTAAIIVITRRKIPSFRAIAVLAVLTIASLIVAWLLLPYNDPTFYLYTSSDATSANQMTGYRLDLWAATLDRWQDSIWLGWGSGSVFWEVYVGWTHTQPHNAVLQFLISWGLVGTAGALWLLGRAIVASHKIAIIKPQLQPLLAILYTLLFMSLLEGMLHYPRFIMLIMILFAVILSNKERGIPQPI